MSNQKNYFNAFFKLSRAFGTAASKDDLLDLIVQNAMENLDGKAACLFLADEKQDQFIPVAQKGLSEAYTHASPMKARKIVASLLEKGYLHFPDATSDPRLENHAAKKAEGIVSILTVPVMVKDRAIGVLSLYTSKPKHFDQDEIQFLQAMAEQGGMAIETSRLLERLEKNSMLFLEMGAKINSSLNIKEVLRHMTVELTRSLGMKGSMICLMDDETETLRLVANCGLTERLLHNGQILSDTTVKKILKGETLIVTDVASDARIRQPDELVQEDIGAIIMTPITAKDRSIGTLSIFSNTPRDFPKDLIMMIQALAQQGALAIQNASMYLALQQDKKDLEDEIWSHRSWF